MDYDIVVVAFKYFHDIFTSKEEYVQKEMLSCISKLLSNDQNNNLHAMPTLEELRTIVFCMNAHSAAGPHSMNRKFFQSCWHIIGQDLIQVVIYFFCG